MVDTCEVVSVLKRSLLGIFDGLACHEVEVVAVELPVAQDFEGHEEVTVDDNTEDVADPVVDKTMELVTEDELIAGVLEAETDVEADADTDWP